MTAQQEWRDAFVATLAHIEQAFERVLKNSGPTKELTAPDVHKLAEGLFLSAWTHWEQFARYLLVLDLTHLSDSWLRYEVKHFRYKGSAERLALSILDHPDDMRWVEWSDPKDIIARADDLLPATHRFLVLKPTQTTLNNKPTKVPSQHRTDLDLMRRIRNAVAHKSDRAWSSFTSLAKEPPFSLATNQMRGITTGRFLSAHTWGTGALVLREAVTKLTSLARALVP